VATYIMLMKFIEPGIESIKGAQAGRAAGRQAAKALGIKWKQQYLVMGEYDVVTIVEAPNEEAMAKFALMGLTGSLEITTMRAFTEGEADDLLKDLPGPDETR